MCVQLEEPGDPTGGKKDNKKRGVDRMRGKKRDPFFRPAIEICKCAVFDWRCLLSHRAIKTSRGPL